jgi:hypothetical protein
VVRRWCLGLGCAVLVAPLAACSAAGIGLPTAAPLRLTMVIYVTPTTDATVAALFAQVAGGGAATATTYQQAACARVAAVYRDRGGVYRPTRDLDRTYAEVAALYRVDTGVASPLRDWARRVAYTDARACVGG